jgi:type II secretory pathway predicted ATPase ExeA
MALELLAPSSAPRSVTSNEDLLLQHEKEMQALAITSLQMKVSMLEDLHDLIQDKMKKLQTYLTKMNLIKQGIWLILSMINCMISEMTSLL